MAPDKTTMKKYLERGLTQHQIVDEWEKDSGYRVSRSTIGMAIARYDLESARPRRRYEQMLPWTVHQRHVMAYDARMLRLEGRRREGLPISQQDLTRLQGWIEALRDSDAVIHYEPERVEGFVWVRRRPEDGDELIRRPAVA